MPRLRTPRAKYKDNILTKAMGYASSEVTTVSEGKVDKTVTITAGEGLSGGGALSTDISLALDVNELTADASPDKASDYVPTWDASAVGHKKVLLQDLGADELNDLSDVDITSPAHNDVLTFVVTTHELILSGDMDSGSGDNLLLSGDEQSGTDQLSLSGDEAGTGSGIWQNIPFSSLPLA